MAKIADVPQFGVLDGLKVFSAGTVIAQPWAAMLMAENGATVVHSESSRAPDTLRSITFAAEQEHRNEIMMTLDIPSEEGREIFFKMIKWADIFMESSKGGTYAKWGLTDDVLWEVNPKLVIVHVSGFGQEGDPKYVTRASYDAIGQAFGGFMYLNGMPDPNPPMRANPYTCDYVAALNACWAALAAYIKAQKTGKGESIDVAQFEVMMKIQCHYPMMFFNKDTQLERAGNADPLFAGYSAYKCQDGNYVFLGVVGGGPMKRALPVLGLDGDPDFPDGIQIAYVGTPAGEKIEKAIQGFCDAHSAEEVDAMFLEAKVPCSVVMNYEMAQRNPHYIARETFIEWDDPVHGKVKGVGMVPKFKKNPGQIWRGAPSYNTDTADVLAELGYSADDIKALYEKKVISNGRKKK